LTVSERISVSITLSASDSSLVNENLSLSSYITISDGSTSSISFDSASLSPLSPFPLSIHFTESNELFASMPLSLTTILSRSEIQTSRSSRSRSFSSVDVLAFSVSDPFTFSFRGSPTKKYDARVGSTTSPGLIIGVTIVVILLVIGGILGVIFLRDPDVEQTSDFIAEETELDETEETGSLDMYEGDDIVHEFENPLGMAQEDIEVFFPDDHPFHFDLDQDEESSTQSSRSNSTSQASSDYS
jgi:hypothetical protein